jgi:hypothetical protein
MAGRVEQKSQIRPLQNVRRCRSKRQPNLGRIHPERAVALKAPLPCRADGLGLHYRPWERGDQSNNNYLECHAAVLYIFCKSSSLFCLQWYQAMLHVVRGARLGVCWRSLRVASLATGLKMRRTSCLISQWNDVINYHSTFSAVSLGRIKRARCSGARSVF